MSLGTHPLKTLAARVPAPAIRPVAPRSFEQFLLLAVACIGGMLPISNMAMLSSSYLALSGDFNADLIDLARLSLGNLLIMGLVQPLINYIHAALGLRGALFLALGVLAVAGTGAAFSASLPEMSLWYAAAGFGGGLFLSLSARIVFMVSPPESRRTIMAIWTFFIGFGSNMSPLLSGYLVEFLTWHSIFLLSPLVALPCMAVVFFLLPDSRPSGLPPFDWCSFFFLAAFAAPTLVVVCYGQTYGWDSTFIVSMIFCAVAALFLFLVSCLSAKAPLLHLENLRIKGVRLALTAAILLILSHVGMRIQMILFMRNVLGYPPSQIGFMFLLPLCVFVATVIPTGIVVATHGNPKPFILSAFLCLGAAGLLLSRLDANADWWHMAGPLALRSFGYALGSASATPFLLRNVAPEKQPQTLPVINCVRFFCMCTCMGTVTVLSVNLNKWYFAQVASQITETSATAQALIGRWTSVFAGGGRTGFQARRDALAIIASSIKKQASVFTFDHLFLLLALAACVGFTCAALSRRVNPHPHAAPDSRRNSFMRQLERLPRRLRFRSAASACLAACLLLAAGCTMGPEYRRPALDLPEGGEDQPVAPFMAERWWELFHDPELDRLEEAALRHNNNLAGAMARVEEAAATAGIASADRLPAVGLQSRLGSRQMSKAEQEVHRYPSRTQDVYKEVGFLSFELDLWGKYRRLDEAARADLLAGRAARDTVRLSVEAETALTYFQLRMLQEQRRIAADMLRSYDRTCKVYETRFRLGQSPETTLRRFQAERAKTQAMLDSLEERRIRCEGALAVLVGFSPASLVAHADTAFQDGLAITELVPPPDVPSSLPSHLLERRPDVRANEGRLMAANARIGAAQAAFFPSFSLTAEGGFSSSHLDRVITDPSRIWGVMGGLTQPVFEGGRLRSRERMAEARYEEALAAYRLSVQDAFRETRDALAGNRLSRRVLASSAERVRDLTRSHTIMEKQYDAGLSSVMDLLDVRRQLLAARQEEAEARRAQLAAVVQLCRALGGGWTEDTGFSEAGKRP